MSCHVDLCCVVCGLIVEMGINKLLPFLKPLSKRVHIKGYSSCVAAIDAMCWIHRALVASASKHLIGEDSIAYLKFILSMLNLLILHGITPIMVFDGKELPAKEQENNKRRERRQQAKEEALRMYKSGKYDKGEFYRKCIQAITVTDEIIDRVIATCKHLNVQVIIAPFEADPQLAYLCRTGVANIAVSEDSDLLVYGCPRVLYKLGKDGYAEEVNIVTICHLPRQISPSYPRGPKPSGNIAMLKDFTPEMFATMCILSGSDYDNNAHIHGMGIVMAYKIVSKYKSIDAIMEFLETDSNWKDKLPQHLSIEQLTAKYRTALCIFMHHWVYDPEQKLICNISESRQIDTQFTSSEMQNIGDSDQGSDVIQVATGVINSKNKCPRNLTLRDDEKQIIDSAMGDPTKDNSNAKSSKDKGKEGENGDKGPSRKRIGIKNLFKSVESHKVKKNKTNK